MAAKKSEYTCIKDDTIQNISRKTAELEARADYKDKRIDEINHNMEIMNNKLDQVLNSFNDLKLQSTSDDKELELRLKAIETKLAAQEKTTEDNKARSDRIIAIVSVVLAALTFYFNYMH